jgi:glycosyltransferase involved in cell wall biosynthesis
MTRNVLLAVSSTPPVTGQGLAGDLLLEHLPRRGFSIHHLDLSRGSTLRSDWSSNIRRGYDAVRLASEFRRTGKHLNDPFLYLHLGQSGPAMLRDWLVLRQARELGIVAIVHIHGGGFRRAFDATNSMIRRLIAQELRHVFGAIVLSPRLRSMLHGLVPERRISSIPNGIDSRLTRSATTPSARHGNRPLRVLHLSNLIATKGYLTVIDIAKRVQDQGLPVEFTLAGDRLNDSEPDPMDIINNLAISNVRHIGSVHGESKIQCLRNHDVFIFPSRYPVEGQPLAILEAMHFGMPILASPQGGIPDVVRDGDNGWCLQPETPDAYVDRIRLLTSLDSSRMDMGQHSQQLARSLYTEEVHVSEIAKLFRSVPRQSEAP